MKLARSREYTVNMGNYETHKFSAAVELSSEDFTIPEGISTEDYLIEMADRLLDEANAADIANASQLTDTPTSFIHTIEQDLNAKRNHQN